MDKVISTQEAMDWFLANTDGSSVICRHGGDEMEVDRFPDAAAFFVRHRIAMEKRLKSVMGDDPDIDPDDYPDDHWD
jgi:hypothetical protein